MPGSPPPPPPSLLPQVWQHFDDGSCPGQGFGVRTQWVYPHQEHQRQACAHTRGEGACESNYKWLLISTLHIVCVLKFEFL